MSVSVQSVLSTKAADRFDFGSMDSAAAKFTAVNGSVLSKDTPKPFTFRPDPTANFAHNTAPSAGEARERPPSATSGYVTESSSSRQLEELPDEQGFYDNITLAANAKSKRKRPVVESSEEEEEEDRQSSLSAVSPTQTHKSSHDHINVDAEHDKPAPTTAEPYSGESRACAEKPPTEQAEEVNSPDEAHLAESLQRDLARVDSDVPMSPDSPLCVESTDGSKSKPSKTPPKRQDDAVRETKKRAFTHRTKTGCLTCRKRKKKCDEHKPICLNCTKGSFKCEGYEDDKIVLGLVASNNNNHHRGRASTHSSIASNLQPYPVGRPNWSDHYEQYRPQASPEARRPSDLFVNAQRDSWGKPLWPQDASPNGPPPPLKVVPVMHSEQSRSDSFLNLNREQPRMSHESLMNVARLGTSIAPVPAGPSENKPSPLVPQPMAPLPHVSPLEANRSRQRQRMLQGLPYHHFNDMQLIEDRNDCKGALERYNNAIRQSQGASEEECGRLFKAIVMPELRRLLPSEGRPSGSLGRYVVIEAPFNCEYGYNIHLDDDVVVDSNCYMQDPCRITVGKRTVIGPNVKFYGRILPTDMRARGGLRGLAIGAPITIEDDCYVGGSCIIMPGVHIGRGSVISAGTTVDNDVPSGVEYGGCPPKIIRGISLPTDNSNHNPHRHDLDDVASLMMKERGFTLTNR